VNLDVRRVVGVLNSSCLVTLPLLLWRGIWPFDVTWAYPSYLVRFYLTHQLQLSSLPGLHYGHPG